MSTMQQKYIAYFWEHESGQPRNPGDSIEAQKLSAHSYVRDRGELLQIYIEPFEKKRKRYPLLQEALKHCKQAGAILLIPQLQNLTRVQSFTEALLRADVDFQCVDQPLVNKNTLPALVENYRQLRVLHSQRIRRGLEHTLAKLGNPNALKEITKVNKPKTENAIMFSLVLAPIIKHYKAMGFSQRKMVQALNDEGFAAPEGGHWVLSQLQKVLERIEWNEAALDLIDSLDEFTAKGYTKEQMVRALMAMNVRSPGRGPWDDDKLEKIHERLDMINDVIDFNRFVLDVYPQLEQYQDQGLTAADIAEKLNTEGVRIPSRVIWELVSEHDEEAETEEQRASRWEPADVETAKVIARRRRDDILHFVRPATLEAAMEFFEQQSGQPTVE